MSFFREPFPEDVTNRVVHDFVDDDVPKVLHLLEQIRDGDTWAQLACLRLANGHVELLPQYIELANQDTRDLTLFVQGQYGPGWEQDYILYAKRTR